jgi:hypothetical protein
LLRAKQGALALAIDAQLGNSIMSDAHGLGLASAHTLPAAGVLLR